MIRITNFDVGQADCFLLHFETQTEVIIGDEKKIKSKYFNLLVDGAYKKNNIEEKIKEQLKKEQLEKIQGVVVTHIDSDHISGILSMVKKKIGEIQDAFFIFNKYDESLISYNQAQKLADELNKNLKNDLLIKSYAKNYSEDFNKEINKNRNIDEELEVNLMSVGQRKKCTELNKEMVNITMLGPEESMVTRFMQNWHDDKRNQEITNAASIILLVEFQGKAILMSGDGYFSEIEKALNKIDISTIDVIKAAHHGAKTNNNRLCQIAKKYNCSEILFTITGKEDKNHPDKEMLEELKNNTCAMLFCSAEIQDDGLYQYMKQKKDTELKED